MISKFIKNKIPSLKKRTVFDKLTKLLELPDIIILMGMRQVGKTSLLYLLIDFLIRRKKISERNIFYLSLDDPLLLDSFNKNLKELEIFLENQDVFEKQKVYVLIDEIQYLKDPSAFLKYYHDHPRHSNLKIIVTGSSSFEMRQKFKDSLAGRKKIIHVHPLSFIEFLSFKGTKTPPILSLENLESSFLEIGEGVSAIDKEGLEKKFAEYLLFGGHPKVANTNDKELKIEELKDIYSSYINKDIKDIGRIENLSSYNNLIQVLSSQIGNLVNIKELSNTLNLNHITLKKYLFLLEASFVIYFLKPFFKNKRKELSKMPKVYLEDLGLKNMISSDFRNLSDREPGALVENFVFNQLLKGLKVDERLFFWRTVSKNEIDFIFQKNQEIIPIEVKYRNFQKPQVPFVFRSFMKGKNSHNALIITKDFLGNIEKEGMNFYFLPAYLLNL